MWARVLKRLYPTTCWFIFWKLLFVLLQPVAVVGGCGVVVVVVVVVAVVFVVVIARCKLLLQVVVVVGCYYCDCYHCY